MLRVITGTARGTKLIAPQKGTRPLTDRIKTSIFDLIRDFIPEAYVLDLYAGSGSFGIESLSRGAVHAIFVDKATDATTCIYKNLIKTHLLEKAEVYKRDVNDFITKTPEKFDLIFTDPPFTDKRDQDISGLARILKTNGLLVYRTTEENRIDFSSIPSLKLEYEKAYGISRVYFLIKKPL